MKMIATPRMTMAPSPRKLPTPLTAQRYICQVCRTESTIDSNSSSCVCISKFNDFSEHINFKFRKLELQIERISDQITAIEQSIFSHRSIISELERAVNDLTDNLNSVTSKLSKSTSSISASSNDNVTILRYVFICLLPTYQKYVFSSPLALW